MCTAVTYQTKDFYFGRTLDYEFLYPSDITIAPRNFPFKFRNLDVMNSHYAIIGMAFINDDFPLFYDAVNEHGLAVAGLNFVGNAVYSNVIDCKDNVAQFELIPWILGRCRDLLQVRKLLCQINITNTAFSDKLPPSQLHWMISYKGESITLESVKEGLKIYDNPVGVLTNNPPFPEQMFNLNNYMHLSPKTPTNTFSKRLDLKAYSRGMGAIGLPGDLSSMSRFVRAVFVKMNSLSEESEEKSVSQFFHLLGSVDQQRGCCELDSGKHEITIYTSCCNTDKGIYYYTTYDNHRINAVKLHGADLDSSGLIRYSLLLDESINYQN
ncbi:MAG: choloylglycine hydrolase [Clostridia bacterium]|nr:choloylglycine hydrolase [Clostridia bacterium]